MPIYNKLVRDGIPAIIELDNKAYTITFWNHPDMKWKAKKLEE